MLGVKATIIIKIMNIIRYNFEGKKNELMYQTPVITAGVGKCLLMLCPLQRVVSSSFEK